MNFDTSQSKVMPFSLPEQNINGRFLDFIIEGDNTPVDIAYQAAITSIKKEFYPVRCFNVTYAAEWSATSIWEHKEPYTEYKTKTVYIDIDGKEHDKPGNDYTDRSGRYHRPSIASDAVRHPWRVQQKTVPITKYKTVVDNVAQTNGDIGYHRSFQPIITYPDPSEEGFAQWVVGFIKEGAYTDSTDGLLAGCEIKPLIESDDFARNAAKSNINDIALKQCRADVPGNRYEDLSVSIYNASYPMEIVLLPIYRIEYEYQGNSFQCWLGGTENGNFFYYTKPQDPNLAAENDKITNEIKAIKSSRLKWGAVSFLAIPFAIIVGFAFMIATPVFGWIIFIASIVGEIICIKKFKEVHQKVKNMQAALENRQSNLKEKREKVSSIVKNDSLNADEKKQAIQEVLNEV